MKVKFQSSFAKDLRRIKDSTVLVRVKMVIEDVEAAQSLLELEHTKKLHTGSNCFRIRIGDYRLGLILEGDEVTFVRCMNRRDLYKFFP